MMIMALEMINEKGYEDRGAGGFGLFSSLFIADSIVVDTIDE